MSARRAAIVVVLGAAAVAWWLWSRPPPPREELAAARPVPPAPIVFAPAPADAGPPVAPVAVPSAPPTGFQDAFCGPAGSEGVEVRYTLPRLLLGALRGRLAHDAGAVDAADPQLLSAVLADPPSEHLLWRAHQAALRSLESPLAWVAFAVEAKAMGRADEHLLAVRRARQLLPADPAVGLALAEATRDSADLDEAIEGLSTSLAADPSPGLARWRARLEVQRDIQRDYRRQTRGGVTLLWPGEALSPRDADQLIEVVDRGLDDAAAFTGTTRRRALTVVVYPSRSELLAVSCVATWAGGLYDGTLRVVAAPVDGGVEATALRHETLHAQLSPVAPLAPRWFHEGVAQAFAHEREPLKKWSLMVRNRVWVPFSSLSGSFQVFEAQSDASLVYAQSYAMVQLLRDLGGERAIADAVVAFQSGADVPTALARAAHRSEVSSEDLLSFLERRLASRGP